jgi:cytochrome c peroxidase
LLALPLLAACGNPADQTNSTELSATDDELSISRGSQLFHQAKYGGNDRTCVTCHSDNTGTISPADAQRRFRSNPNEPLFRRIDSDDSASVRPSYSELLNNATFTVGLNLPANVSIAGSSARSVVLRRGVPTTMNTPAVAGSILLWDGRAPTLQVQALGAIQGHAQATVNPPAQDLNDMAAYEKTLFNSNKVKSYVKYGTVPTLPAGSTDSEKRGAVWFRPDGFCGACHGGPNLDTATEFSPTPGSQFQDVGVSEFNLAGKPGLDYVFQTPDGPVTLNYTDPGLALTTGDPSHAGLFKIPTLWGVSKTAPYFHDNSAKTFDDVMLQYDLLFQFLGPPFPVLTAQDKADIIAYMKLLQ